MSPKRLRKPESNDLSPRKLRPRRNPPSEVNGTSGKPVTNLFNLPRELRDMIYDNIWNDKRSKIFVTLPPLIGDDTKYHFAVRYGRQIIVDEFPGTEDDTWIFTNKRMFTESITQLHRKAIWKCYYKPSHVHSSTTIWKPLSSNQSTETRGPTRLTPFDSHSLQIYENKAKPLQMARRVQLDQRGKPTSVLVFKGKSAQILRALSHGLEGSKSLQSLTLRFHIDDLLMEDDDDYLPPRSTNMAALRKALTSIWLPNLRHLHLGFILWNYCDDYGDLKHDLRNSVQGIGTTMAGKHGTLKCENVEPRHISFTYEWAGN